LSWAVHDRFSAPATHYGFIDPCYMHLWVLLKGETTSAVLMRFNSLLWFASLLSWDKGIQGSLDSQLTCNIPSGWFYNFTWNLYSSYFKAETTPRVFKCIISVCLSVFMVHYLYFLGLVCIVCFFKSNFSCLLFNYELI
jgi:hypothetical protein